MPEPGDAGPEEEGARDDAPASAPPAAGVVAAANTRYFSQQEQNEFERVVKLQGLSGGAENCLRINNALNGRYPVVDADGKESQALLLTMCADLNDKLHKHRKKVCADVVERHKPKKATAIEAAYLIDNFEEFEHEPKKATAIEVAYIIDNFEEFEHDRAPGTFREVISKALLKAMKAYLEQVALRAGGKLDDLTFPQLLSDTFPQLLSDAKPLDLRNIDSFVLASGTEGALCILGLKMGLSVRVCIHPLAARTLHPPMLWFFCQQAPPALS